MNWSCRQPSIGLEGSSRTIAACGHTICDSMDHLSHLCPRREEVKRYLAQSSGRQNPPSTSNRKPSVGWGTTKRGWGRDDEFSEGSK